MTFSQPLPLTSKTSGKGGGLIDGEDGDLVEDPGEARGERSKNRRMIVGPVARGEEEWGDEGDDERRGPRRRDGSELAGVAGGLIHGEERKILS